MVKVTSKYCKCAYFLCKMMRGKKCLSVLRNIAMKLYSVKVNNYFNITLFASTDLFVVFF